MRRALLMASAALVALALPSHAADVVVNGSVSPKCSLNITSGAIVLGTLGTDANGLHPGGATNTTPVLEGTAMCNNATNHIDVVAKPLLNTTAGTVPAAFTNRIDYKLASTLLPTGIVLDTAAVGDPAIGVDSNAPRTAFSWSDTAGGSVTTDASVRPVIAGDYAGTISVTLTPS